MIYNHFIVDIHAVEYGTEFMVVLVICNMAIYVPLAFLADRYFQNLAGLRSELGKYSLWHAESFCCKHGHIHPDTGASIICDRELVFNSIARWHGGGDRDAALSSFDDLVQTL